MKQLHDSPSRRVFSRASRHVSRKPGGAVCAAGLAFACVAFVVHPLRAAAQGCTTQANMPGAQRQSLADTTLALADAIKSDDAARVQGLTDAPYNSNFDATAHLVHATSAKIAADTPRVTQLYLLDATARQPDDTGDADFSCALSGSTGEVDFSIPALPPGAYAFTMAEADGPSPWLLSFLLKQEGSAWKMAGFYPHPRAAAGQDGLAYWRRAREEVKAGHPWLAWVLYGEADQLLRPANFVASTHLDQLRTERHGNAPGELRDGISASTPLVIKAADGTEFRFTQLGSEATDDDRGLNLILGFQATPLADNAAASARNLAAARAFLAVHPELRQGFTNVGVLAEIPGQPPFATEEPMAQLR